MEVKHNKIRIYFNHWFTQAREIIELMRKSISEADNSLELNIIGSHKTLNPSYRWVCDIFLQEPEEIQDNAEEYLRYCLFVCKEYNIDIFFPYKHLDIITKHQQEFNNNSNTKVVTLKDYEVYKRLNNKLQTYTLINSIEPSIIPEHYKMTKDIDLNNFNKQMCIKRAEDIGGKSYRLVVPEYTSTNLDSYIKPEISFKDTYKICNREELILMPHISETEISYDCLLGNKTIIVGRHKINKDKERIELLTEGKRYDIIKSIGKNLGLETFNIQFRGKWLLEINTRMAGGITKASTLSVNFPRLILLKVLGISLPDCVYRTSVEILRQIN